MGSGKKMWTVALLATAVLVITAACGGEGTDGKIKLRFSYWGTDARQKMTEEAIKRFEAKNPNIDVVGEFSGFGSYYETLATKVAGEDAPDVITIEIRGLREYAERGTLADLSSRVNTADIDGKVLATGAIDGKQFAIPTGVNAWSLVVDPKAIESVGQKLPDDTRWTWEEYIDLAAKITAGAGGKVYGTQQAFNPAFLQIFAAQRGERFYDGNKIGVSPNTLKAWWAIHRKLAKTKGSPDIAKSVELGAQNADRSLFATGNGAMGMWWSNELGAISKASGGKVMELLRMPKVQGASAGGMFLQPAMFYTASAKSEHAAEAAKFIDFMINDPEAGRIILSDRGLPASSKVLAAVQDKLSETDRKTLAFLGEIKGELTDPPAAPPKLASAMEGILKRYTDEVLFGRMTPDDAARKFITEANASIAG
ncbi:carbohydrate ABC transporter substrate-binding protein (CUT1 family) [Nonomuraea polychroma]|uniref:Carbohydrate ABC transporter substrate-binding protein (CUT1 family) n=1 Tax=Nonomuraea polychroma TaxID=46176 RepID=A0A438MIA1_9ACTN|nr:extracellular solute-binding protein [Nonomuraea polychroma]RVX45195.1 carbohydrate ABC transporter substrate-binding protein (CUT1 family) [Nonomuraea polychroma]